MQQGSRATAALLLLLLAGCSTPATTPTTTTAPPAPEPPEVEWADWPMVGGGPQHHSARNGAAGSLPAWEFSVGQQDLSVTALALADGVLVARSYVGRLYALDASTGALKWTDKGGAVPIIAGRTLLVTDFLDLRALDLGTGRLLWKFTVPPGNSTPPYAAAPAVHDGRVIFGTHSDLVFALDLQTGTEIWRHDSPGENGRYHSVLLNAPAVLGGGRAFIGSTYRNLTAFDEATGQRLWVVDYRSAFSSPAIDGNVLVVNRENAEPSIAAFDVRNGTLLWKGSTGGARVHHVPVVADGRAYVFAYDNQVYAFNLPDGSLAWRQRVGPITECRMNWSCQRSEAAPAYYGGTLFVPAEDGNLYALNARNGTVRGKHPLPLEQESRTGDGHTTPIVANGFLYIGTDWTVRAIPLRDLLD